MLFHPLEDFFLGGGCVLGEGGVGEGQDFQ